MKKGFSIIEVTFFIFVLVIASIAIFSFMTNSLKIVNIQKKVSQNSFLASRAMNRIERDLKQAQTAENGNFALEAAEANEIIFYSDYDLDGDIERIRYFIQDSILKKGVIDPLGFPAQYDQQQEDITNQVTDVVIDNPVFQYFDKNQGDVQLSTPAIPKDVSMVKVYLKVTDFVNEELTIIDFSTSINLRNLNEDF